MAGPVISISLRQLLDEQARGALDAYLRSLTDRCVEHPKPGCWALNLDPELLGITRSAWERSRPFLLETNGSGNDDGTFFETGHFIKSDWGFLPPLLGFTPVAMLSIIAMGSSQVDHTATALLAAEAMDITGGIAFVELYDHQVKTVSALPGVLAAVSATGDQSPFALGDSRLLRAFAATPAFRLLK